MKCSDVIKRLSSLIDNELPEDIAHSVNSHINECSSCKDEYDTIKSTNITLKKEEGILPGNHFRNKLKANLPARAKKKAGLPLLKWLPAPLTAAFVLIFFVGYMTFSPAVYSIGDEITKEQITDLAKSHLTCNAAQHLFSPAGFLAFCEKSCNIICDHCQRNDNEYQCQMKGCHHEHGK